MKNSLFQYVLQLADDSLILGQRLGEWCGHGPALELDMALTNISLDLFGQARSLYQYAAEIEDKGRDEDDLAYLRNPNEFKNCLLVEMPNGDFAQTILRQYFFDEYQVDLYEKLSNSADQRLTEIAQKSLKETLYHRRLSAEWVKRLGDGTAESHERAQKAVDDLWHYTGSIFDVHQVDREMHEAQIAPDLNTLKKTWLEKVSATISEATLTLPEEDWMHKGGRGPVHTEHLGFLLAEMQILQRTYPGAEW